MARPFVLSSVVASASHAFLSALAGKIIVFNFIVNGKRLVNGEAWQLVYSCLVEHGLAIPVTVSEDDAPTYGVVDAAEFFTSRGNKPRMAPQAGVGGECV